MLNARIIKMYTYIVILLSYEINSQQTYTYSIQAKILKENISVSLNRYLITAIRSLHNKYSYFGANARDFINVLNIS